MQHGLSGTNEMRIWILLGLLALTAAVYTTQQFVAPRYGAAVENRFLERLKDISPSKPLTAANLREWAQDNANVKAVRGYVMPVIIPLDVLFLLAFGSFLGFASCALAGRIEGLSIMPMWVWWVFPGLYIVADACEGVAIASLLSWPETITRNSFAALSALTFAKIATVWFAIIQFLGLAALALGFYLFSFAKA